MVERNVVSQSRFDRIKSLLSRHKKASIFLILLLITGLWGWSYLRDGKKVLQYQTATAEKGTLVTFVSASGSVSTGNSAVIKTDAAGVVAEVYVKKGDGVVQGQGLAEINLDEESRLKAVQAWSAYLSAQNSLASANINKLTLQQNLEQDKSNLLTAQISAAGTDDWDPTSPNKQKVDQTRRAAELALQASQQRLVLADAQIAKARSDLNSAWLSYQAVGGRVVAPISGTVSNLVIAPGLLVGSPASASNTSSTTASSLGTISLTSGKIQTEVNLSEMDAAKIKPGQKATLTLDALPGKTFAGDVLLVNTAGQVNSGVTTYPATIVFDASTDNVFPHMSASAKIITGIKNDVVLVPSAAIQSASGQSSVRLLKDGQINQVAVEVGAANETQTEVISGISEGDTVVTNVVSLTDNRSQRSTSPFGVFGGGGFRVGGGVMR